MTDDQRARPGPGRRRAWIPAELAGRYEIDRELGDGASAVTVSALDRRLGRRVAIKILKPESDRDAAFSQRFNREARAAAAINNHNVVDVYDVGQEGDLYYLVMQFVDGSDLKTLIERERAIPWQRAVGIARDVLAGLSAIHGAGIVHRDIKPQNVLIGNDGAVMVTDFGVAHVERDTSLTAAGTTVGTAAYMAPEQAQGQAPTPAADVYAVGVMLYEMVTGRLPFNEPTAMATMLAHIQREAPPPVAPRGMEPVPQGVALVIAQAMTKDPTVRFRSATAMRHALEFPETGAASAGSTGRTRVVPAQRQPARTQPSTRSGAASPPRKSPPAAAERPGGFGGPFLAVLIFLAVALVAVAGALWLLEERPNLFANGGDPDPTATVIAPTSAPGVIEPVDQDPTPTPSPEPEPSPTPTPPPEPTPTLPPAPTATQPVIAPAEPTTPPVDPSTDEGEPQIIEPIEGSTVAPGS
jgi:serine/threonine-protein kinase